MASNHSNEARTASVDVDKEYQKALQTKSFADLWAKVHNELDPTISTSAPTTDSSDDDDDEEGANEYSHPHYYSSPLPSRHYSRLPNFLLEPSQEFLHAAAASDDDLHALLLEFVDTTSDACSACTTLLASIDRARSHNHSMRRLLLRVQSHACSSAAFAELASHVEIDNPLSPQSLVRFHLTHARYAPLLRRLTRAHRKIARRVRLIRAGKKAAAAVLIGACGAATVVALVVAAHATAGIGLVAAAAAAPAVVAAGPRAAMRWVWRKVGRASSEGYLARMGEQVDAAAKGAYIVGRDLDTLSRMVRRAHDEVEHGRDVARMLLRNREEQLVREVVKEVEGGEEGFAEQLGELEEHVYLCLITINRSRRLVAQEMKAGEAPQPAATAAAARET